jgi:phosphohistidine phosphatase
LKQLTLVRHAHAEATGPQSNDFDRVLTRRGREDAADLAQRLLERGVIPDLLIASTARRATQTAQILARSFNLAENILKREDRLYLAQAQDILQMTREVEPEVRHLMIVGHNPGLSQLLAYLAPDSGTEQLATATAVTLAFDAQAWAGIHPGPTAKDKVS